MSSQTLDRTFLDIPYRAVVVSVVLHLFLPLLFTIMELLNIWDLGFLPFKKTERQIYQNYIQVDVVALPDLKTEDKFLDPQLPVAEKAAEPKVIAKPKEPEDVITLPKIEEKKAPAKAAKKEITKEQDKAIKKLEEDLSRQKALDELANQAKARTALKGNVQSQGTSAVGNLGEAKQQYSALLHQAIKTHFKIYPWHKRRKLVSVVQIEVLPNGKVGKTQVIQMSGDVSFENAVHQAIQHASQAGLPIPKDLSLLKGGVTIQFSPED